MWEWIKDFLETFENTVEIFFIVFLILIILTALSNADDGLEQINPETNKELDIDITKDIKVGLFGDKEDLIYTGIQISF